MGAERNPIKELSAQSIFLGCLLAVALAASNAYLGLKVGRTIAGSIPAAVLSMGLLHWVRRTNILQHNMVQTIASAGESVAASLVFVMPALVMLGCWTQFSYVKVCAITVIGGGLGILFSVPLRRVLIVEKPMPFPEGQAVAEVLQAGQNKDRLLRLLSGGLLGVVSALVQTCWKVSQEALHLWKTGFGTVFGTSFGLSPVMTGVGYIIGIRTCADLLVGVVLGWGIILPVLGLISPPDPSLAPYDAAMALSKSDMRYIAVGAMMFGGAESIFFLGRSMIPAMRTAMGAFGRRKGLCAMGEERDIPMGFVLLGLGVLAPIIFGAAYVLVGHLFGTFSVGQKLGLAAVSTVMLYGVGFLCAAMAGYLTGIGGTTNLPVSGVTISAIILFSVTLLLLFGQDAKDQLLPTLELALIFAGIVAIGASMCGDNLQDLKAGYLVGATPWKQQLMLFFGVACSAIIMTPILQLLLKVYGFGEVVPAGMDPSKTLAAPQATLMKTIASGVFSEKLQWHYLAMGGGLGSLLSLGSALVRRWWPEFRIPVLSVALGIYLPPELTTPMIFGGILSELWRPKTSGVKAASEGRGGVIAASGLIAGETLTGLLLAVPFAIYGSDTIYAMTDRVPVVIQYGIAGILLLSVVMLFRYADRRR